MNRKTKAVIAVILLIALALSGAGGYLLLLYQPRPVVNDHTAQNARQEANENPGGDGGEDTANTAVFSSGVEFFTESAAREINSAIRGYEITNMGMMLEIDKGTSLDALGVGDIFYLEGDPSTPLRETYIGKILSVSEDSDTMTYVLDDPMVDEVFDLLDIELSEVLTNENIYEIETAEGVTVTAVDSLEPYFQSLGSTNGGNFYGVSLLSSTGAERLSNEFGDGKLLFEYEFDLLEELDLDEDSGEKKEEYEYQEGHRITVYSAPLSFNYHSEKCPTLIRQKESMSLLAAVNKNLGVCHICNPPVLKDDEGEARIDSELTFFGKIGLEDMVCDMDFQWDIISGSGLEDLSLKAGGNFVVEAGLRANCTAEIGGRATTISFPMNCVKVQGLSEKLFPVAFVGYNFVTTVSASTNEQIRMQTFAAPITLAFVIYVDGSGKLSLSTEASFGYNQPFEISYVFVEDGNLVEKLEVDQGKGEKILQLSAEVSGDVDIHLGASFEFYCFNLNLAEVVVAQVGAEAEGKLKVSYSSSDSAVVDGKIAKSYYARAYLKALGVRIKLNAALKIGRHTLNFADVDLESMAIDLTLAEWGAKNPTQYSSSEMSYTVVTASDAESCYYKDTDGNLIRETDGYRTVLYSDGFFTICGIDESYIYLLRNNPDVSGTHDIYRVSVQDGTNRKIVSEITNCLTMDERYIYYVSNFDENTIVRLDRDTLKEENFYHASNAVRYMKEQGEGFYVVTEYSDLFSWFTGPDIYYSLLDDSGNVITEYGKSPAVANLSLFRVKSYYYASQIVSSGYLRNTAKRTYWLSADKTAYVEAKGESGWNSAEVGIFTTLPQEDQAENAAPYTIVLYRAADGSRVEVTDVQSDQAFFTLCQSSYGDWYFFDQTEDSLILYTMKEDFSGKTAVKTFALSELPCSLTECGMTIMNDRIYFYTIPDNSSSAVLYRYDIV